MSLAIDINSVVAVLLADGWHKCERLKDGTSSFDTDSYEYMEGGTAIVGGGQVEGVPSTGATWTEKGGTRIAAPLTAVLAVRIDQRKTVNKQKRTNIP